MLNKSTTETRDIKRVFIIGATGFIGTALAKYLSTKNLQICCFVHQAPLQIQSSNIDKVQGNLTEFDWRQLEDLRPDVIYHLARMPGKSKNERRQAATRNARANEKLIQWMHTQNNPPLLVFGSGTLVYGNHGEKWVDETTDTNPISFQREYFKAEQPILKALNHSDLPVIIVRPPWIYGPGSWFEWFFWKHMQEKGSVPQYGSGQNFMTLIHIDDCAGLIHHIAKYGKAREAYNIVGHSPIRHHQFVKLLGEISGLPEKKYSQLRLWWQLDRAAREALTFSLKSTTRHSRLLQAYQFQHPGLWSGLHSILERLNKKKSCIYLI